MRLRLGGKLLKKTSVLLIIVGLILAVGCSGGKVSEKEPPDPSVKKPLPADTYVPKGTSVEDYLKKYYDLYTKKKFKESYKMTPSSKRDSQSQKEYEQNNSGFDVESYELGKKQEKGNNIVIEAKLKLKQFGDWTTTWTFVKNKKGIVVEDYSASGSGN